MKMKTKKLLGALLVLAFTLALLPAAALAEEGMATIVLSVPEDIWEDGGGYQMLLDADHDTFGSIIPESGPLARGDATEAVYAEFEYKIPHNAEPVRDTQNMLRVGTLTLSIPAGTYDWFIVNPTPGESMWIARDTSGNIPGRMDDYVFMAGKVYTFEIRKVNSVDGVFLTVEELSPPAGEGEVAPNVLIPEKKEEGTEFPEPEDTAEVDEATEEELVEEELMEEEPVEEEPAEETEQEEVPETGDFAGNLLPAAAVLAIAAAACVGLRKRV